MYRYCRPFTSRKRFPGVVHLHQQRLYREGSTPAITISLRWMLFWRTLQGAFGFKLRRLLYSDWTRYAYVCTMSWLKPSRFEVERLLVISAELFDRNLQQQSRRLQELREAAGTSKGKEFHGVIYETTDHKDEQAAGPSNENKWKESHESSSNPMNKDQDAKVPHQRSPAGKKRVPDRVRAWRSKAKLFLRRSGKR